MPVSGNTDGIIVKDHPYIPEIVKQWEQITGLETEEGCYSALYSRDVNNYIAVKTDGSVKRKGEYAKAVPLYEQIVNTHSMVVLTDAEGLILHSLGDDDFLARADKVALRAGALWSEEQQGTNHNKYNDGRPNGKSPPRVNAESRRGPREYAEPRRAQNSAGLASPRFSAPAPSFSAPAPSHFIDGIPN